MLRSRSSLFIGAMIVHVVLLLFSAASHFPNVDESAHYISGVGHLHLGRFDLYRVNPPLVRMVSALPSFLTSPAIDWSKSYQFDRPEFSVQESFFRLNGRNVLSHLFWARVACIPFSLIGAWFCYLWGTRLFGEYGIVPPLIWFFNPAILGWGSTILPDLASASMAIASAYLFCIWLDRPDWGRCLKFGFASGLAMLTKSTLLVLFPIWFLVLCIVLIGKNRTLFCLRIGQFSCSLLLSLLVVNSGYFFEDSARSLRSFTFVSESLGGADVGKRNIFRDSFFGFLPSPLPGNYLLGVDYQKRDFEVGKESYFLGTWKYGGWPSYYLVATAIKSPIGFLLLTALGILVWVYNKQPLFSIDFWILTLTPLCVFGLVSSQTGFNHHSRYILPAMPFLFVLCAGVGCSPFPRIRKIGTVLLMIWVGIAPLQCRGHYISYFNEAVGGPKNGGHYLLGSNVDFGQDLTYVLTWLDKNPEKRPVWVAIENDYALFWLNEDVYRARMIPNRDAVALLANIPKGWYIASENYLHGNPTMSSKDRSSPGNRSDPSCEYLLNFPQVDSIGYSAKIFIVDGKP